MKEYNKICKKNDDLMKRVAKGEFNPTTTRVLHLTMNPVKQARKEYRLQVEGARSELITKLSEYNLIDEKGTGDTQLIQTTLIERLAMDTLLMIQILLNRLPSNINKTSITKNDSNSSSSSSSNSNSNSDITKLEIKLKRYQEVFTKLRSKYKEIVYLLTGWKINMDQVGNVTIEHMYATSENDRLAFKYDGTNEAMDLVNNAYSEKLAKTSDSFVVLSTTNSFPGFLATLTMDLLDQTTMGC